MAYLIGFIVWLMLVCGFILLVAPAGQYRPEDMQTDEALIGYQPFDERT